MAEPPKPRPKITGSIAIKKPSTTRYKLYIATPCYGSTFAAEYVMSLFSLLVSPAKDNVSFKFCYFDYADVVIARNYLVTDFYYKSPDCTHLLFIDDDMGFDPALIADMLRLNEDVVGTIYPKRAIDLKKLHAAKDLPFEKALAKSLEMIGSIRVPQQRKNEFASVSQCGTGIMLISRKCIDTMVEKLPGIVDTTGFKKLPFGDKFEKMVKPFDKITVKDLELSEDFSFCHRWIEGCGGTVWASTHRDIRHAGRMVYSGKYADL
jgi:hypothetical protein